MSLSSGSSFERSSGLSPPTSPMGVTLKPKSLRRHHLPIAAHLYTPSAPPGLDLSRPILLYKRYTSSKVSGVSLRAVSDGSLVAVGPTLVIPDCYTGWFAIVSPTGHTAPFYLTVEQVTQAHLNCFLTRYDVPAYVQKQDEEGRVTYQKKVIHSGHVLSLQGIYEDLNVRQHGGMFGRQDSSLFHCDKYAQCLNYQNEVVFLPFSASGRFYATAHKTDRSPNHIYLMSQLLQNYKLPITVKLVCGYMPRVPCSFTGLLRLQKAQKETVILGCTMTSDRLATLLEIDVTSNFALTPVADPLFSKTPIFLKTVSYCQDNGDAWRRQIKVTHHVMEKRSRSLTRTLSDKFIDPLSSSRPLNLAFLANLDISKYAKNRIRENRCRRDRSMTSKSLGKNEHKSKVAYSDSSKKGMKKYSRENAYIFDLPHTQQRALPEKPKEDDEKLFYRRLSRSVDNIDYCQVLDISPLQEHHEEMEITECEEEDDHYAKISDFLPDMTVFEDTAKLSAALKQKSQQTKTYQKEEEKVDLKEGDTNSYNCRKRQGKLVTNIKDIEKQPNAITVEALVHENNKMTTGLELNEAKRPVDSYNRKEWTSVANTSANEPTQETSIKVLGNEQLREKEEDKNKAIHGLERDFKPSSVLNSVPEDKVVYSKNVSKPSLISEAQSDDVSMNNKDHADFSGNQIKILLTGSTIVIRVKDDPASQMKEAASSASSMQCEQYSGLGYINDENNIKISIPQVETSNKVLNLKEGTTISTYTTAISTANNTSGSINNTTSSNTHETGRNNDFESMPNAADDTEVRESSNRLSKTNSVDNVDNTADSKINLYDNRKAEALESEIQEKGMESSDLEKHKEETMKTSTNAVYLTKYEESIGCNTVNLIKDRESSGAKVVNLIEHENKRGDDTANSVKHRENLASNTVNLIKHEENRGSDTTDSARHKENMGNNTVNLIKYKEKCVNNTTNLIKYKENMGNDSADSARHKGNMGNNAVN